MKQETLNQLYAISVSIGANIRLLEKATSVDNKEAAKLFISELKKDRERLRDILGMFNDYNIQL